MGSSASSTTLSSEFLAVFRANADASGTMSFARFMELALYEPHVGYYRQEKQRIGYGRGTDFFTAGTSGAVFGELVAAACVTLLDGRDPQGFTFVEIGAEPSESAPGRPRGVLAGVAHPFCATRTIGVTDRIELAGNCVVFSNELFDAQPFNRFVFRSGRWRELGVRLHGAELIEIELPGTTPAAAKLPAAARDGYVIDAPLAAAALAAKIAAQPWSGLFVAADYGKSWRELLEATPFGTARAYHRHRQSNDLLARPGEQDLTCHVCWDWLAAELEGHGFVPPTIEPQEVFFVRHAGDYLARAVADEAARFSPRKLSLMQLLHPSHLGRKFQVLHALRGGKDRR